uniref:IQ domain-containing protein K isoform X5 n=1 Tax=Ictidomys tridecemlineatus TaxID=43179 RepID=UPI001A9E3B3F|nr:IQ domain-containing protein K isoform X5 [Ictidomys tridecemlineatus]
MAASRQTSSRSVQRMEPSGSAESSVATRTPVPTLSSPSPELPVSPGQVAELSGKNLWEQICEGSPRKYLETYIFPILLPGMTSLLHQAKKEKCLERKRTKFIACDFLTEWLYNQNPKRTGAPFTEFFSIPFVDEWLKDHPRPPIPLSLLMTDVDAAIAIQSFWRAYLRERLRRKKSQPPLLQALEPGLPWGAACAPGSLTSAAVLVNPPETALENCVFASVVGICDPAPHRALQCEDLKWLLEILSSQ